MSGRAAPLRRRTPPNLARHLQQGSPQTSRFEDPDFAGVAVVDDSLVASGEDEALGARGAD